MEQTTFLDGNPAAHVRVAGVLHAPTWGTFLNNCALDVQTSGNFTYFDSMSNRGQTSILPK